MADPKQILRETLDRLKAEKEKEAQLRQEKNDADRNKILENISGDLSKSLQPVLADLAKNSKLSTDDIRQALAEAIQISMPEIKMPEIKLPAINVPQPKVTVNVPKSEQPIIKVAPTPVNFPEAMRLAGIDNKHPLHVSMVDQAGKPMMFPASMGASGGRADFFTIKDIQNSSGASIIDNDGNLKVAGSFSVTASNSSTQAIDSSGNVYSQANPFPVTVVSGGSATTGSALVDSSGVQYSGSNPLPTTATITLPSGQGDSTSATRVVQAGDSVSSVYANNPVAQGDSATALRVVQAGDVASSVSVVGITGPIAQGDSASALRVVLAGNADSSVVVNSGTLTTVTAVTGITNSVQSALIDSSGVQYSGSNPVPTTIVSGALTSTVAVGDSAARSADNGGNPIKVGGIARTTNPSAYGDGDRSNFGSDKLGRALSRPVQVRELIATAYVTLSNGTETTLATASAGGYLDLIYVMGANTSGAAQQVDIRAGSGGNIVLSLYIPANSTAGVALPVPFPQDATGNAWTADLADVTNSNVLISALFSKEL